MSETNRVPEAFRGSDVDVKTEIDIHEREDCIAIIRKRFPAEGATARSYTEPIIHKGEIDTLIKRLEEAKDD